jgi:predicted N-acetyltransferase YhbS
MKVDLADSAVRSATYGLLDTSFSGLSARIAIAADLGAVWHEVSTAFVAFVDGEAVAHTGVIEIPMVIAGRPRKVAGVHAVCTRPGHRGRGHARAVITEALHYVDSRYDLAVLTAGVPDIYTRFGFRPVAETVFDLTPTSLPPVAVHADTARRLSQHDSTDLRVTHRLLAAREPVSPVVASIDPGWLFLIDEVLASWGMRRVYHAASLDALIVFEMEAGTLRIFDIVAARLPPLAAILRCIPEPFERVETYFAPDRLEARVAGTRPGDPTDCLMVRGEFDVSVPFMLSPLARC